MKETTPDLLMSICRTKQCLCTVLAAALTLHEVSVTQAIHESEDQTTMQPPCLQAADRSSWATKFYERYRVGTADVCEVIAALLT